MVDVDKLVTMIERISCRDAVLGGDRLQIRAGMVVLLCVNNTQAAQSPEKIWMFQPGG
jgi:hypothetical protein